tara:strand:+ start:262 stop:657 length:396 start_codon:yes stop_codon:yes gene_type:complete
MTTTITEIRELKTGSYIVVDGEPCKITDYKTSKPGKHGEAKARIVAVGLFDNRKRSLVHPVKHKVHTPMVDRKKAQVLAMVGAEVQVMDLETFETFNIPLTNVPEEFHNDLDSGREIQYLASMGKHLVTRV